MGFSIVDKVDHSEFYVDNKLSLSVSLEASPLEPPNIKRQSQKDTHINRKINIYF